MQETVQKTTVTIVTAATVEVIPARILQNPRIQQRILPRMKNQIIATIKETQRSADIKIRALLLFTVLLASRARKDLHILVNKERVRSESYMETISAREIDHYIFDKNYLLVDVRSPSEYRRQHIRGAVCVPKEYILKRIRGFGNAIPVLYCDRGGLSMQAARELEEHGYKAISVVGGIQAYRGKYLESDQYRR